MFRKEKQMRRTIPTSARNLRLGDRIYWLGEVRTMKAIRPSLGCGHIVTFTNGLTASWNGSWGKVVTYTPQQ